VSVAGAGELPGDLAGGGVERGGTAALEAGAGVGFQSEMDHGPAIDCAVDAGEATDGHFGEGP